MKSDQQETEPHDLPAWKPFLRGWFWVRKSHRGWCVCWHTWNAHLGWGVSWGIGYRDLREAKAVRRFLNRKVSRGIGNGLTMQEVVKFVESGSGPETRDWGKWIC